MSVPLLAEALTVSGTEKETAAVSKTKRKKTFKKELFSDFCALVLNLFSYFVREKAAEVLLQLQLPGVSP